MEPHNVLNDLDYIVIGVILLSGLLALMRGFVRELFSLIAWIGAYFAAANLYHPFVSWTHHYIKSDKAAEWAAIALVYVLALIVLMLIGAMICSLIKGRALTSIDRSLGFLFGLARGGLVVCLLYLCAVMMLWPDINASEAEQLLNKDRNAPPELLMKARTRPLLDYGATMIKGLVPKDMIDKTLKNVEAQKEEAEKAAHQKALDMMSTPTPPPPETTTNKSPVDVNKLFNQGNKQ